MQDTKPLVSILRRDISFVVSVSKENVWAFMEEYSNQFSKLTADGIKHAHPVDGYSDHGDVWYVRVTVYNGEETSFLKFVKEFSATRL